MQPLKIKSRHRVDLMASFPHYSYQNPVEPWRLNPTRKDNIIQEQIASFTYFWLTKACGETGLPGLSLITPNLPYCITIPKHEYKKDGPVFDMWKGNDLYFFQNKKCFGALIISAALPWFPCFGDSDGIRTIMEDPNQCDGADIRRFFKTLSSFLVPGGILLGVLFDALSDKQKGFNTNKKIQARHAWSVGQFRQQIITPLEDIYSIVEYDTLRNGLTFNFVLEKKPYES